MIKIISSSELKNQKLGFLFNRGILTSFEDLVKDFLRHELNIRQKNEPDMVFVLDNPSYKGYISHAKSVFCGLQKDYEVFAAYDNVAKKVVGYAMGWKFDQTVGCISGFFVNENYRKEGFAELDYSSISKVLFERVHEWFEKNNLEKIEILVLKGNDLGYKHWTRQGFIPILDRVKAHIKVFDDSELMIKYI